jgi:hypothetical protein
MNPRTLSSLGLALLLVAAFGCDKATPVAPDGVVLTISASPSQVTLTGSSTITVIGRKPDGQPLNPGTEVRFSTNIGTVDPIIATVRTGGAASTTFRGDGRSGTATITASTGTTSPTPPPSSSDSSDTATPTGPTSGIESVSVRIVVGLDPSNRPTLLLSANPSNISISQTSTITIIGRNPDRSPVAAGQTVLLTSTLGTLNPVRPTTRADGTAVSILTAGSVGGEATIGAILGSSDQATTTVTIRDLATAINLIAAPGTISPQGGEITLTANVINGQGVGVAGAQVSFGVDHGTLSATSAFTDSSGNVSVKLTLTSTQLTGVDTVTATASTASSTGGFLTDTVEIDVD